MNHVEQARLDANADRLDWYAEKMKQDGEYISYLLDRHDRLQQDYDDRQGDALLAVTICSIVTLVLGFALGILVQAVLAA